MPVRSRSKRTSSKTKKSAPPKRVKKSKEKSGKGFGKEWMQSYSSALRDSLVGLRRKQTPLEGNYNLMRSLLYPNYYADEGNEVEFLLSRLRNQDVRMRPVKEEVLRPVKKEPVQEPKQEPMPKQGPITDQVYADESNLGLSDASMSRRLDQEPITEQVYADESNLGVPDASMSGTYVDKWRGRLVDIPISLYETWLTPPKLTQPINAIVPSLQNADAIPDPDSKTQYDIWRRQIESGLQDIQEKRYKQKEGKLASLSSIGTIALPAGPAALPGELSGVMVPIESVPRKRPVGFMEAERLPLLMPDVQPMGPERPPPVKATEGIQIPSAIRELFVQRPMFKLQRANPELLKGVQGLRQERGETEKRQQPLLTYLPPLIDPKVEEIPAVDVAAPEIVNQVQEQAEAAANVEEEGEGKQAEQGEEENVYFEEVPQPQVAQAAPTQAPSKDKPQLKPEKAKSAGRKTTKPKKVSKETEVKMDESTKGVKRSIEEMSGYKERTRRRKRKNIKN